MADPNATSNMEEYKKLAREHAELRDLVGLFREWKRSQGRARKDAGDAAP